MKKMMLLIAFSLSLVAGENGVKEGIETAVGKYRSDSCDNVKAKVRSKYEVVKMDLGCRCFINDAHQWACDIEFTYTEKKF